MRYINIRLLLLLLLLLLSGACTSLVQVPPYKTVSASTQHPPRCVTEIGSPILGGQIGEVLVFFLTNTHTHTNNFFRLAYRSQKMDRIERINAHYTWFQVQKCLLGVSTMINFFRGPDPQKPKFWGVNRHFKPILQKVQIPISSKLCIGLAQNLTS